MTPERMQLAIETARKFAEPLQNDDEETGNDKFLSMFVVKALEAGAEAMRKLLKAQAESEQVRLAGYNAGIEHASEGVAKAERERDELLAERVDKAKAWDMLQERLKRVEAAEREGDELRERLGKLWAQLHPDCAGGPDCGGCPGCKGVIY